MSIASNIKVILEKKGWVDIPARGVSMLPLIEEGDVCRFTPLSAASSLQKGEIFLFQSEDGRIIGHRYFHSFVKEQNLYHIFKGDTNVQFDPPVLPDQVIGKLVVIKKRGLKLHTDGRLVKGWSRLILTLPLLPRLFKASFYYWNRVRVLNEEQSNETR